MQYQHIAISFMIGLGLATCSYAKDLVPNQFTDAFKNGNPALDFRLRFEDSKQAGLQDAKATTLRTTIGFETAQFSQSTIRVEMVNVTSFFGQRYNPAISTLARPQYTAIYDPKGSGLTEAKLSMYALEKNVFMFGRQYIQLDNERFVGKNNIRQYPQSFDALSLQNTMIDYLTIYYAYVPHVDTNNGNNNAINSRRSLTTNLVNLNWSGFQYGNLAGYVYFNVDHNIQTNSHTIAGIRLSGTEAETSYFDYLAEIARQQGKFNNPSKYTAYYAHGEVGKTIDIFTGQAGIEKLGGSSNGPNQNFITPLGSIDSFNGMAEVFRVMPSRGLQDYYAKISGSNRDLTIALTYHYFRLDAGPGSRLAGYEFDVGVDFNLTDKISLNATYANYNPRNSVAPKTRRFWVMLTADML